MNFKNTLFLIKDDFKLYLGKVDKDYTHNPTHPD